MSSEDEEELPKPHASFAIPMSTAGIVLLLPVVLLHALNKREIRTRNTKFTKWLMIGVLASNGVNQSLFVLKCLFCGYCTVITGLWFSSKAIVKAVNLLFLIHRGKLVQGMNPILSKKWFEKILPTIIVVIICGFIFSILKSNANEDYTCTQYEDWNNGHTCVASAVRTSGGKGVAASAIGLDALITTFLMVLFIVPLYRVYNVDLGQMNHHQIRQRKKLKDLLIWSMVMTFINQVTSTFFLISIVHQSHVTNVLYLIGLFDPAINVWTAWLMVTSNRQYLRNLCCFMCSKYSEEREVRRQMSGLTNVPSRSATITSVKMSQVSVDIASAEMKVSEGDLLAQILPTGTKS